MNRAGLMLLAVLAGCGGNSAAVTPTPPTIAIVNECPDPVVGNLSFTQARLTAYIPVLQAHDAHIVQRAPQGSDIVLTFYAGTTPIQGSDSFHSWDGTTASASVYVGSEMASGNDPLLAAAHEIAEVTVDPQLDGTEIVDPVVCYTYNQFTSVQPGQLECGEAGAPKDSGDCVPDFVLPSWNGGAFPYDHMELLTAPKQNC